MKWTKILLVILITIYSVSIYAKGTEYIYQNQSEVPWSHLHLEFKVCHDGDVDVLLNAQNEDDYILLRIRYGEKCVLQLLRYQYGDYRLWQEMKPETSWKVGEWYRLSIEKAPWIDLEDWRPWKIVVVARETGKVLLRQGIENEMPALGMGKVGISIRDGMEYHNFRCTHFQRYNKGQALRLAPLFGDGMVLQQNKKIPVWGQAESGQQVKILFHEKEYETRSDEQGNWVITMDAFPVMEGQKMKVMSCGEWIEVKDIAIGEVWLASGQSNMEMRTWQSDVSSIAQLNTPDDGLRLFVQPQWPSEHAVFDSGGEWMKADSIHAMGVSAVAYSFAQKLRKELKVPVGIICSYWGGTAIESWIPFDKLATDSLTLPIWQRYHQYKNAQEQHQPVDVPYPYCWDVPGQRHSPGYLFNGMIAPLIPYAIKGVLWYQGESNSERARQYEVLFPMLLDSWRERWNEELPFYYVQVAGYDGKQSGSNIEHAWPHLRDAQRLLLTKRRRVGMTTAIDLGHPIEIHPVTKAEVGHRLCRLAMHDLYHYDKIVRCGPIYSTATFKKGKAFVYFDETGDGLCIKGEQFLRGFIIAGADRVFYPAHAVIDKSGKCVVLQHERVADPVAVRYAWENNPDKANLVNSAELPAASFRSDSWELSTDNNL